MAVLPRMPSFRAGRSRAVIRAVITSAVSVAVLIVVWRLLGHPTQWRGVRATPLSVTVVVTAAVAGAAGLTALTVLLAAAPRRFLLGRASRVRRFATLADRMDAGLAELASPGRWAGVAASTLLCRLATAAQYAALL